MEAIAASFLASGTTAAIAGTAGTAALGASLHGAAVLTAGSITAGAATTGLLASASTFIGELTFGDILSGGLSGFAAISSIAAGQAAETASKEAALFEEFGEKQEILKGRKDALAIFEKQNDLLAQNLVNIGASGITGEGSPKAAQEAIIQKAEFETGITRSNAIINAEARKSKARQLRIEGRGARIAGQASAAKSVAGFFLNREKVG